MQRAVRAELRDRGRRGSIYLVEVRIPRILEALLEGDGSCENTEQACR